VAFVEGDVVTAAKRVVDAGRKYPALILKGGYLEGRVLDAAEAASLATLESREVMLSRIAGLLQSDLSRAAAVFQAVQARFLRVLEAYKEKVPAGDAPVAEAGPGDDGPEAPTTAEPAGTGSTDAAVGETPAGDAGETEGAPAAEPAAEAEADSTADTETETPNAQAEEE
jgi:large subunit ribosomal protein L10